MLDTLESALVRLCFYGLGAFVWCCHPAVRFWQFLSGRWLASLLSRLLFVVSVDVVFVVSDCPFDCMVISAVLYLYSLSVPFLYRCVVPATLTYVCEFGDSLLSIWVLHFSAFRHFLCRRRKLLP